jgi:O-antigen ligase
MWLFSPNKKITATVAAIMLMGVLIFSSSQWKEVASSSFDTSQSTAQTRLTTWRLSLEVFVDHPMGVGMNNIPNTMYKYADAWETPSRWWGDVNHSFWLTALAEGGIIGFILVMMILWHNVKDCLKISQIAPINDDLRFMKFFGYAFFGSLIGFLAAGTLLTVNYYPHLWYMTGIITAGSHVTYLLEKEYK